VSVGGVASYWKDAEPGALVFPALSLHVPLTEAPASSGPPYVGCEQDAIPEVVSEPPKAIVSGWLYQPFASGERVGAELVICGGVASYWRENVRGVVFPARSPHEPVTVAEPSSGPE
jgi:hypothetical protein